MATSLSDVLSGKEQEAPPQEVEVEREAPAEAGGEEKVERVTSSRANHRAKEYAAQGRDAAGKFLPKDDVKAEAAPPAPDKAAEPAKAAEPQKAPEAEALTPKERAAFAKAADETRKRQALEQELAALRSGKPPAAPAEKKAFWDDPDGALRAHQEEVRTTQMQTRMQTAELIARSRYKDFDEKVEKFTGLVQQTPGLAQAWLAAADPAEFAYRTAKSHIELEQAGSLDQLRADIETKARADERKKVEEEFKAKHEALEKQRAALPGSLSDVRGAASSAAPVWTGPTSLTDILK